MGAKQQGWRAMSLTRRGLGGAVLAGGALAAAGPKALALNAPAPGKTAYGDFGIDLTAIDPSIAPGDDFYRYTNNGWLKNAVIPADRSAYSGSMRETTETRTRAIMESAAGNGTANGRKITDYYRAWADEAGLERRGLSPLRPELAKVAAVATPADLARSLA